MLEFIKPGDEYNTREQPAPSRSTERPYKVVFDTFDKLEWYDDKDKKAQSFLRELYAEREKMLAEAGVNKENFAKKALQILEDKGDMELARAIMGKYVLSPEQEIHVFKLYRCLIPEIEPVEYRIDLDSMLPPPTSAEPE